MLAKFIKTTIFRYDDEFHESIKYYDKDFPVFGS